MRSPLNSYANPGGEIYISTVGMIQNAANAVATAGLEVDAKEDKRNATQTQKDKLKLIGKPDPKNDNVIYTQADYDIDYPKPIKPPKTTKARLLLTWTSKRTGRSI